MNTETTQRLIRLKESDPMAWPEEDIFLYPFGKWFYNTQHMTVSDLESLFIGHWSKWLIGKLGVPVFMARLELAMIQHDDSLFLALLSMVERVAEQQQADGEQEAHDDHEH